MNTINEGREGKRREGKRRKGKGGEREGKGREEKGCNVMSLYVIIHDSAYYSLLPDSFLGLPQAKEKFSM